MSKQRLIAVVAALTTTFRVWRRNRDRAIAAARMRTTDAMRVMVRDAVERGAQ